jgi:hypothetical protein
MIGWLDSAFRDLKTIQMLSLYGDTFRKLQVDKFLERRRKEQSC